MTQTPENDLDDIRQDEQRLRSLYRRELPATRPELDERILSAVRAERERPLSRGWGPGLAIAASVLIALFVGTVVVMPEQGGPGMAPQAGSAGIKVGPPRDAEQMMADEQTRDEERRRAAMAQLESQQPGSSPAGGAQQPKKGDPPAAASGGGKECVWKGTLRIYLDANQNGRREEDEPLVDAHTGYRLSVRGAELNTRPGHSQIRPGELVVEQGYPDCVPRQFRPRILIDDALYRMTTPAELEDNAQHLFEFGVVRLARQGA